MGQRFAGKTVNLDLFNEILKEEWKTHGIRVIALIPISLRAASEPDLTARDGLHPTGERYRLWAERILVPQ